MSKNTVLLIRAVAQYVPVMRKKHERKSKYRKTKPHTFTAECCIYVYIKNIGKCLALAEILVCFYKHMRERCVISDACQVYYHIVNTFLSHSKHILHIVEWVERKRATENEWSNRSHKMTHFQMLEISRKTGIYQRKQTLTRTSHFYARCR